jgi:hypothetical protein
MVLRLQGTILAIVITGCASTPRPYPWNFPPVEEWNAPLETSWVNLVDGWRNLTAPRKKVWNPIIREYEPDFGYEIQRLNALDRDLEEHEMYQ